MFAIRCSLARRRGAIALLALAVVSGGCGGSQSSGQASNTSGKALEDRVNPDDLYQYVGKGKAKRKVEISRRERVKLLHEAANKAE
jgi:hypothetical protein